MDRIVLQPLTNAEPARPRGWAAFAVGTAAVAIAHGLVLACLAPQLATPAWPGNRPPMARAPVVLQALHTARLASHEPLLQVETIAPLTLSAPRLAAIPSDDASADAQPAASTYFFADDEVDRTAQPESDADWTVDVATLDGLATSRVVFIAYIAADGAVLRCDVTEPASLTAEARRMLAAQLQQTRMRPALRHGAAVASRRRIELYSEGGV